MDTGLSASDIIEVEGPRGWKQPDIAELSLKRPFPFKQLGRELLEACASLETRRPARPSREELQIFEESARRWIEATQKVQGAYGELPRTLLMALYRAEASAQACLAEFTRANGLRFLGELRALTVPARVAAEWQYGEPSSD